MCIRDRSIRMVLRIFGARRLESLGRVAFLRLQTDVLCGPASLTTGARLFLSITFKFGSWILKQERAPKFRFNDVGLPLVLQLNTCVCPTNSRKCNSRLMVRR